MVLDGRKIAQTIRRRLKSEIAKQKLQPGLVILLIGRDPASLIYVKLKQKAAERIGIKFKKYVFPAKVSQKKVLKTIQQLNKNKNIHGLIVQMPLPQHLDPKIIVKTILPEKDVDGFRDQSKFISPTHQAILRLLKAAKQNLKNKKALILAKNPVFANPLIKLLAKQNIKSSWKVRPPKDSKADILITALGKAKIIKPEMIKKNSIIIDVGYSRFKGQAAGDVDPRVEQKKVYLSPVPGGVGPLTVAYLLRNVYLAAKKAKK